MRRIASFCLVAILVVSFGTLMLKGSVPTVPTGTWVALNHMVESRTGAAAATMYDGRILVTGGTAADGTVLASVEVFDTNGHFTAAPAMHVARTGHTATWLADGYVLVTGGTVAGGGVTNSAEMYDPLSDTWTLLPATLSDARTGHTATALSDGNVLLAGGENSAGALASVEVFDLVHEKFTFAGAMSSARKAHAAAAFADGRVLLVGGTDAHDATLGTTDIFDQATGITAGPAMATPRANATATTLLDGTVLIAGGSYVEGAANGVSELNSAEVFNPSTAQIETVGATMTSPRASHMAVLLPNNNSVLFVGGKVGSNELVSSEIFVPWTGQFKDAGSMTSAHTAGIREALTFIDGLALVAGGSNQANAELTRFATVKTDKTDYTPGQFVTITGSGWQPGETVTLSFRELPNIDTPAPIMVTADAAGNISNSDFAPDAQDLGLHFVLTAVGAQSGLQAQNTFTDGTLTVTVTGPGSVTGSTTPLSSATCTSANSPCTAAIPNGGSETLTATGTVSSWTVGGANVTAGCTQGNATCTVKMNGNSAGSVAVAFQSPTPSLTNISPNNAIYGATAISLTATGTNFFNGTSTITFNGADLPTTCSSSTTCTATIPAASLKTAVGALPVVVHNGAVNSATQNFTLNQRSITVTATTNTKNYDGTTSAAALPTITSGNLVTGDTAVLAETYDNANAGSAKTLAPTASIADGNGGNNYAVTFVSNTNGQITPSPVTVTATAGQSKTYGTADPSLTYQITSGALITGDSLSGSVSRATGETVGAYAIGQGTLTAGSNYTLTFVPASFNITPAALTVTVDNANRVYGAVNPTFTGTLTGVVAGDNITASYASTATATSAPGDYPITATFNDPGNKLGNYSVTNTPGTLTVSQATQAISFSPISNKTYGDAPFVLRATSDSGLAVAFTATGTCSVAGTTLSITGAGNCSVTASQPGNGNYSAAADVVRSFTIGKADAVVTVTGGSFPYDGAAHAATATVKSLGGTDLGAATITYAPGTTAPVNAGTYTATADFAGDSNYNPASATATITISKVDAGITWATPSDITYGTALSATQLNATVDGGIAGSITYTPATGTVLAVGAHTLSAEFVPTDTTNYNGKTATVQINVSKAPTQTTTLNIVPAHGGVSGEQIQFTFSFAPASGGAAPTGVVGIYEQGISTPVCSVPAPATAQTLNCSAAFTTGTHNVVPKYLGDSNYVGSVGENVFPLDINTAYTTTSLSSSATDVSSGATVTLTAAVAVVAPGSGALTSTVEFLDGGVSLATLPVDPTGHATFTTLPLSAGAHSFTASYLGTSDIGGSMSTPVVVTATRTTPIVTWTNPGAIVYGTALGASQLNASSVTSGSFAYTPATGTVLGAGSHTLSVTFTPTDTTSFEVVTQTVSINVSQATLAITAVNASRGYGDAGPAFNYQVGGFVNGDGMSAITTLPVCTSAATQSSSIGSYPITCAGATAANYGFNYLAGSLSVTPAQLTVTPNNLSRVQGQANPTLTGIITGIKNSDPITATYSTTAVLSSLPGKYPIVVASVSDGGSGALANYVVTSSATGTLTVGDSRADLVESGVAVSGSLLSGSSMQVTDTTTNQEAGTAGATSTYFYLSYNGTTRSIYVGSRNVATLVGGASSASTTTMTIPPSLAGTYYLLACANATNAVTEANTANNCFASAAFTVIGADLVETGTTLLTATPISGGTVQVTETAANQGAGAAGATSTYFYLSYNGTTKGTYLGLRNVAALNGGTNSGSATTTLTIPAGLTGTYYILACANATANVAETNNTNNCMASSSFTLAGPDMVETGMTMLTTTPGSGGTVQVSETATNQGSGNAVASVTYFYLSYNGTTRSTYLGSRNVGALAAGASTATVTTTLTIPAGVSGTYYMLACANATGTVAESNTANNCSSTAAFTVAGPDLVESGVTVLTSEPVSGGTLQFSDTTTNQGAGAASASATYFYLSYNGTTKSIYLGSRNVAALPGLANTGVVTTTLPLRTGLAGTYYFLACANGTGAVAETNNANNCSVSTSFLIK